MSADLFFKFLLKAIHKFKATTAKRTITNVRYKRNVYLKKSPKKPISVAIAQTA
ncbi:hypothetical protein HMPREF1508_1548 [Shuttleworthella sp. MSX8B]|nr:hypothetical protein HMPREF1508_1548 [Shuttleworthia sp. MSX8B]